MGNLSHSSVSRYQMCPKSYEYHYIKKIRPKVTHAALLFGSALDLALNVLLTEPDKDPKVEFEKAFTNALINNKMVYLPDCTDLVYANADFDADIMTHWPNGRDNDYDEIMHLKKKKEAAGLDSFTFKERKLYNLLNWLSLKEKGLLMIDAYKTKILPKIEKVHCVQRKIELANETGDMIVGFVDLVADIKDHGTVILDHKTSGSEYEADAVLSSPQLSLYLHILGEEYNTRNAGFIVLRKQVLKNRTKLCPKCGFNGTGSRHKTCSNTVDGKRCDSPWDECITPEISIQFLVDKIPEITESIVMENFDEVNRALKAGLFPRNFNSCLNTYGGKCPYYDLCYKNIKSNLVEIKEDK